MDILGKKKDNSNFIQTSRYTIVQITGILAVLFAGFYISFESYVELILFSGIMILSCLLLPFPKVLPNTDTEEKGKSSRLIILPNNKRLGVLLFSSSLLLGVSSSMVSSILPAVLKSAGWSISSTSIITTISTILTLAVSLMTNLRVFNSHTGGHFLAIELVVSTVSIASSLMGVINMRTLVPLTLLVESSFAGFFIFKEIMEYSLIPKDEITIYLGIIQSSFLVGDSLGSVLGSALFTNYGTAVLF